VKLSIKTIELFNEYNIPICNDKNVLEINCSGGYTTLWIHLMPHLCTFQHDYHDQFDVLYTLPQ
jgi:hypothetical protein